MNEIKCPSCGKVFTIDESSYADIVRQVRDEVFEQELRAQKETAVHLAEAEKDKQIGVLRAELESQRRMAAAEKENAVREAATAAEGKVSALEEKLRQADMERKLAVQEAVAAQEREKNEADKALLALQTRMAQMEGEYRLREQRQADEQARLIRQKDEEIEYYRDMKARLSTKMVGETLEQHCEIEFNRMRTTAFPNAYFEKDNDAREGTKGDFIFRDYDENGVEYISIMFEMKNEMDETATKHKNEDFLKKLDKDRTSKGCEYAVLVTLLEADSEYYNTGIVDMSYRYPRMYVIRPQFFLSMISLLRNAARNSLQIRRELAASRMQHLDVEAFNDQLIDFKDRFSRSYRLASDRFEDAIREIDKSIKALEKVKQNLQLSADHLRLANSKAEDLTIKKLTAGNPTLQEQFREAGIDVG